MAVSTITYSNKVALNENQSVADINKVKADDMNEIKSVVNNNASETNTNATNITNLQTYSTSEVNTGKIWIDGKPIYRKVTEITSGFSTSFNVPHNISNLDVLRVSGNIYGSSTNGSPIYYYSSTDYFRLFWNGNNVSVRYGSGVSPVKIEIIMEYTKTTD